MHILLTGVNHATTPLDVRERVAFSRHQIHEALPLLADQVGEGVILSTCNRTEVYTVSEAPSDAANRIRDFVADYHGLEPSLFAPHLYDRTDVEAVRHLFRVASGLDSMILGESEILGQVRSALTAAAETGSLGAPVSRLFHRAIRTGRRVRDETDVGRNALSVSYAAVGLAQRVLGDLRGLRVLLIGAGDAGQLVARALRTTGSSDLMIANRTVERGEEVARSLDGRAVDFSDLGPTLEAADIVITATEAPDYVLERGAVASAMGDRPDRPMFLFDLSVPRNIDPTAGSIDDVNLFNIDDLSSIAEENLEARREAAAEAEEIVEGEVVRFMSWWDSLEVVPLIRTLRQRAERTREAELARALRKLPNLSAEEIEALDAMTRSIINRLLHDPTVALKRGSGQSQIQAARDLFRLWDDAD